MGTYKYEVGQKVFVPAEIVSVIVDEKHGTCYELSVRDCLFVEKEQSNIQYIGGIAEKDIKVGVK